MADLPVECGNCGAHFMLDPSGNIQGAACSECGGDRFFRSQPSATQSDGALRNMVDSDSQKDQGGNPLGEGTIMGRDGEQPAYKRDNFMHGKVAYPTDPPMLYEHSDIPVGMSAQDFNQTRQPTKCALCHEPMNHMLGGSTYCGSCLQEHPELAEAQYRRASIRTQSVSERVEMSIRTLNMEPYAPLWDESYLPKEGATHTAGPLAALPLIGEGLAAGAEALGAGGLAGIGSRIAPTLMKGALLHGIFGGGGGDSQGGQQAGGMSPLEPEPAPSMQSLGSADIPFVLTADLETPHSVKSVGEQHDDPEDVDQKEFNVGDNDPNAKNPNTDDSGASGEDEVRDQAGFGPNSPAIERMTMVLPLLLHYFNSEESGQNDPIIRGLHEAMEQESPGYLKNEHPQGHQLVQMIIDSQKHPHGVHAGVNAVPAMSGGLPAMPMPSGLGQNPGGGTCPNCGGVLAGDGSCPQCGAKQHPQGGAQMPAAGGTRPGGASMPPNAAKLATGQGPITPEQIASIQQLLLGKAQKATDPSERQAWLDMVPDVPLNPSNYAKYLAEIQGNDDVPPPVDPSQQTPPPAQMNPPGGMPMPDPSQAGGGGMPMQPMARTADGNSRVPRCPNCGSGTTTVDAYGDPANEDALTEAKCHSCHKTFKIGKRIVLTDVVNPILAPAADQHHRHDVGQDSSLTFKDSSGQQLREGQIYDLKSPTQPIPDEVEVLRVKPDAVDLKLVGEFSNLASDGNTPDFSLSPQDIEMNRYSFEPSAAATEDNQPQGGMPGLEQIPQSGQTTDEISTSYPNPGTAISHLVASDTEPEMNEDICHKCGADWIEHIAASPTRTMHECARCGSIWETSDDFAGREASSTDLGWLYEGPQNDDFFGDMERARSMAAAGQGSRSLSAALAKDSRYERIHEVLTRNAQERQRTAGRHFTPGEQRELINERGTARNSDLLDLSNTHYETRYDDTGKANGLNAPDEHLVFGL